ncbi:hypothetical protein HID58_095884 [Brassica napus]|uniref:Uncharacterized protein n=1 Tax=Brassica napus TaxID=3708 RepID=A0ABQ7X263_BRANA|nr:hypothetical protein HID58_095884 [Brassica napus]
MDQVKQTPIKQVWKPKENSHYEAHYRIKAHSRSETRTTVITTLTGQKQRACWTYGKDELV